MLYHYVATDKNGKVQEAEYDADNLQQILQYLNGRDLRPVAVKPIQEQNSGFMTWFERGISLSDKVFLAKYLALMLRVGTDLLAAINILLADFEKPAIRKFLLEIRDNISKGKPFYVAFESRPKDFSIVEANLIKAAEASGNLQDAFEKLSESMQAEAELRSTVRSALVYPIILLCMAVGIFLFLVTFALPKIATVFMDSGVDPPPFSKIVFGVGLFINDNIFWILLGLVFTVGPGVYFFFKVTLGRRIMQRFLVHLPVIKNIYRDLAVQRFASTFGTLMRAGLPILQTAKITAEVVGLDAMRVSLIRIADEGLSKGLTIGEAFRREKTFPKVVTNLVSISEKAGHLEEVLETLAVFYSKNVKGNIRTLVSVLEPALLLFMGILVATIALAIIIPIYQLTSQF